MPTPVSETTISRSCSTAATCTVTEPPRGVNFRALEIRLSTICFSARGSASTSSGSDGSSPRSEMPAASACSRVSRSALETGSRASISSRRSS